MNKRKMGTYGEDIACKYLINKGYTIAYRNFTAYTGEIDIIAKINTIIVFVEVKYRTSLIMGAPRESVNKAKQLKIRNTALMFLANDEHKGFDFRFDVIEIINLDKITIEHIENAFQ